MHIGIPITNRKPGMVYNEGAKFWFSNVDDYDYKIEYLKFEEGTPFPEVLHRNPHVAYLVDDLEAYIADADSVICGPWMPTTWATAWHLYGRTAPFWSSTKRPDPPGRFSRRTVKRPPDGFPSGGRFLHPFYRFYSKHTACGRTVLPIIPAPAAAGRRAGSPGR